MTSNNHLQQIEVYLRQRMMSFVSVEADGENHVIANFGGLLHRYDVGMLLDAIAQNLHPLAIPHTTIER